MSSQESFFAEGDARCWAYKNVRDLAGRVGSKAQIEDLWARFRHLGEPNFRDNARHFLLSPLWEMELWDVFDSLGFRVQRCQNGGPDFNVRKSESVVYVEAAVPIAGSGADKVPEPEPGKFVRVPEDQIVLRFRNTIAEKLNQYKRALAKNVVDKDFSYVVAISSSALPRAFPPGSRDMPFIVKSVYPIGNLMLSIDIDSNTYDEVRYGNRFEIQKRSGSAVDTDVFLNQDYSMISAILYTHKTLLDQTGEVSENLILIHNFCAENPLPRGWLGIKRECWVEGNHLQWA